jgi:hypothetical protein
MNTTIINSPALADSKMLFTMHATASHNYAIAVQQAVTLSAFVGR